MLLSSIATYVYTPCRKNNWITNSRRQLHQTLTDLHNFSTAEKILNVEQNILILRVFFAYL